MSGDEIKPRRDIHFARTGAIRGPSEKATTRAAGIPRKSMGCSSRERNLAPHDGAHLNAVVLSTRPRMRKTEKRTTPRNIFKDSFIICLVAVGISPASLPLGVGNVITCAQRADPR